MTTLDHVLSIRDLACIQMRMKRWVCTYPEPLVIPADVVDSETEMISTRMFALTRLQRNHKFMDEVFLQAALGPFISSIFHSQLTTPW